MQPGLDCQWACAGWERVMGNVPGQAHVTPQLHDPTPDPDGHEKGVETGGWVMSGVGYEVEA